MFVSYISRSVSHCLFVQNVYRKRDHSLYGPLFGKSTRQGSQMGSGLRTSVIRKFFINNLFTQNKNQIHPTDNEIR